MFENVNRLPQLGNQKSWIAENKLCWAEKNKVGGFNPQFLPTTVKIKIQKWAKLGQEIAI